MADLGSSYFALVMATGIVSIGLHVHGLATASVVLMWLTAASYAILVVLTGWRLVAFRARARADLTDPGGGIGIFMFGAGGDLLGVRLALAGHHTTGLVLLAIGALGWIVLGYVIPWNTLVGRMNRPLMAHANGTWFVWVVASQTVAVLAATLESTAGFGREEFALLAVLSWAVGVFLYAVVGIFVAGRLLGFPVRMVDISPPYWVAMGATAITVLAGARILQMADTPIVLATRDLVAGVAVVFWAWGTWLIPPLLAVGWWRHVIDRVPLRYDPGLWLVVFPLGMYGVAGYYLGVVAQVPVIRVIGEYEIWVGVAAWVVTFVAMLAHLVRTFVLRSGTPSP
ncbi:tellurite resistance/C4-dicarboxylate transporter family protein [Actinopolymorpha pittospori]